MDPSEVKKAKDRSPAFPFISLARALERAREFYAEEKRGAAPFARAVMHWRYSEASSGGLQTVAALRQYGLMDDVGGSGKARQLRLTDLALRIILDTRPDSEERAAFIRQAALTPSVAEGVHARWPDGLPSDSTLHHYLVLDKKFNESTAGSTIKILKANQQLASIAGVRLESAGEDSEIDKAVEGRAMDTSAVIGETKVVHATTPSVVQKASDFKLALRHKGVAITIQFSEEPTKDVFEYLERYSRFEKENAGPAASATSGTGSGGDQPA